MSRNAPKTFADAREAFASQTVLRASRRELEQLLTATSAEQIEDPATRAQAHEMSATMRQLLDARARRKPSKLALLAAILAFAALIATGAQGYFSWRALSATQESAREMSDLVKAMHASDEVPADTFTDFRTETTVAELARRAPSLRKGTMQAWWAGEQAREVQRLEAQAKRQLLAGDREGAARSASQADAIRTGIDSLALFERPQGH